MLNIDLCGWLLNQLADAGVAMVAESSRRPINGAEVFIDDILLEDVPRIKNEPIEAEKGFMLGVVGAGSFSRQTWQLEA
jgi:hypothetical protein